MKQIPRPLPGTYPAYYASYISALVGEDLSAALRYVSEGEWGIQEMVPDELWNHRYAPGKWTIKEVFQHIVDVERVFSYRALCIARNERASLPGMDENAYQDESRAGKRTVPSIMREMEAVRHSTMELFDNFDDMALSRSGIANGNQITVPALGWIIAGHSAHHMRIIRERYLVQPLPTHGSPIAKALVR
ncbi:MAG: DinB family protein [Flavobacteriales bacterium]